MQQLTGIGASTGAVVGPAYLVTREEVTISETGDPKQAFTDAASAVRNDLEELAAHAKSTGREEAGSVLAAQAMMAADPMLADSVNDALDSGEDLQTAVESSAKSLSDMLAALPDEYMAARSADVLEVSDRIVRRLAGVEADPLAALAEPSILVAKTLTAAETAGLEPEMVLGFVTEEGGATSHVAVIARSLGIPAVVGAEGASTSIAAGVTLAMDGATGDLIVEPGPEVLAEFAVRADREASQRAAAAAYHGTKITFDSEPFWVAANVGNPDDVARAVDAQSDGVGLYRTEFLFLDRANAPSEEEQYQAYASAVKAFDDPVVIRTFDIGGDKPAAYLDTPPEENPFLGLRGVRIYADNDALFTAQVRALLRASAHGALWIMVPMVATVEDITSTRAVLDRCAAQLESEGADIGAPKLGIMIEVPSAALIADQLAAHVDFFSIGTNDLTQYTMAADRMNGGVAKYGDAAHPGVLRLCAETAAAGARAGIQTSVCGEAGADPVLSVLFAAMGITKLSVAAPSVDLIKARIATSDPGTSRELLDKALRAPDASSVRELVNLELG